MFGNKVHLLKSVALNENDPFATMAKPGGDMTAGMLVGTRVATSVGWRSVETLAPGDLVLTFDNGLQQIKSITRGFLPDDSYGSAQRLWPLFLPQGSVGNDTDIILQPDQPVLIEADLNDRPQNDPFILVPAGALEGFGGIERLCPDAMMSAAQLIFEQSEIVFLKNGALTLCPGRRGMAASLTKRRLLPLAEARDVLKTMYRKHITRRGFSLTRAHPEKYINRPQPEMC